MCATVRRTSLSINHHTRPIAAVELEGPSLLCGPSHRTFAASAKPALRRTDASRDQAALSSGFIRWRKRVDAVECASMTSPWDGFACLGNQCHLLDGQFAGYLGQFKICVRSGLRNKLFSKKKHGY